MIIGENREAVIKNIKAAAESGDYYRKVEINDPVLTANEQKEIVNNFLSRRKKFSFKAKSVFARAIATAATAILNRDTEIIYNTDLPSNGGFIITSNHFGPLENTAVRHLIRKNGKKKLNIVSQTTNFAMTGFIGFLMNHADTVPLLEDFRYLSGDFLKVLEEKLNRGEPVLIYPEQEMWFNYRKPRPPKRGAYYFAAKLGVPVVSCFVELRDKEENDTPEFKKTKYVLHVLEILYPQKDKSAKENSIAMCERDSYLKADAYKRVYGKELDYKFEHSDIAGWVKAYEQ